jgi:hypothetical protein
LVNGGTLRADRVLFAGLPDFFQQGGAVPGDGLLEELGGLDEDASTFADMDTFGSGDVSNLPSFFGGNQGGDAIGT